MSHLLRIIMPDSSVNTRDVRSYFTPCSLAFMIPSFSGHVETSMIHSSERRALLSYCSSSLCSSDLEVISSISLRSSRRSYYEHSISLIVASSLSFPLSYFLPSTQPQNHTANTPSYHHHPHKLNNISPFSFGTNHGLRAPQRSLDHHSHMDRTHKEATSQLPPPFISNFQQLRRRTYLA